MKKWVTIFPHCKNFHLIKDVGYIPYMMNKEFGFESYIATFNEDGYEYLNTYVKGLKFDFLNKSIRSGKLASLWYILTNAKKIDVLNVFHISANSLIDIFIYKLINKNGKAYLKLDASEGLKSIKLNKKNIQAYLYNYLLRYCDLVSVETTELYKWIQQNWNYKVEYVPNGFWVSNNEKISISQKNKKNYITTVGWIGTEVKNNETLVEAFIKVYKKIPGWNLCLVGEMTGDFKEYINTIFKNNEELSERILIKGYINDLDKLNDIYLETKIFCMTSISESFGLVFVEALKNGCYIITSNVLAAKDVTDNEKIGCIFNAKDINKLAELLEDSCINYDELVDVDEIQKYAYKNFDWKSICENIILKLK